MAMTATYVHEGARVPYTPSGAAVSPGDVIVQNTLIGIATNDIADGQLGSLAVEGVFDFPKATGAGTAIAAGKVVYWDAADSQAKEDSETGANEKLGVTVAAAADADTTVRVLLER